MTYLVVMVGAPGSGKSELARRYFPAEQVFSLDRMRGWVSGDESLQECTGLAVDVQDVILHGRARYRVSTVLDNTSATAALRLTAGRFARPMGIPTVAVVMTTPLAVCLERNAARDPDRYVPPAVVRQMHQRIAADLPPGRPAEHFAATVWHGPEGTRYAGELPEELRALPWLARAERLTT